MKPPWPPVETLGAIGIYEKDEEMDGFVGDVVAVYEHFNQHRNGYDMTATAVVRPGELLEMPASYEEMAEILAAEFAGEEHIRQDGSPLPYPPQPGEFRVFLWEVKLPQDWTEDDGVPEGFTASKEQVACVVYPQ